MRGPGTSTRKRSTPRAGPVAFLLTAVLLGSIAGVGGAGAVDAVEDLGVPVNELRVQQGPLSPDPSGSGFVQLLYSFPGPPRVNPGKPFEVLAVNLQTKAVKRVPVSSVQQGMGFEVWAPREAVWSRGKRPRMFFRPNGAGGRLMSWDPKTQTVWDSGRFWGATPGAQLVYSLASGADNWIIGGGANDSAVVRYNPETGQLVDGGPASLPGDYRPAYAQQVGSDASATYVLTGRQPYRVVARPTSGGPDRILMQFDDAALFHRDPRLHQTASAVYANVALKGGATYTIQEAGQMVTRTVPGTTGARADLYWALSAGSEITPLTTRPDVTPPKSPLPANPPETILDKDSLVREGKARLWYRFPKDRRPYPSPLPAGARPQDYGWQVVDVPVNSVALKTSQAIAQPGGGVFGSSYHTGGFYSYDPGAGATRTLGPAVLSEVYSLLESNGKIYIGGYSKAKVLEYDPTRPWTTGHAHPFAVQGLADTDPRANPREIANFMNDFGAMSSNHMVTDSAGRIYVGTDSSRNQVGGGLGILTPVAGGGWTSSSIWSPLRNYVTAGLGTSTDGRHVALSTRVVADPANPSATPSEAGVFVLDTQSDLSRFTAAWVPLPGVKALGGVVGVSPTRFVGFASVGAGQTRLYLLDAVSGAVISTLDHAGELMSSGNVTLGPDGHVYGAVKVPGGRRIVRIDPGLSAVSTVAEVAGDYERFSFVGRDLYLTGTGYHTNGVDSLKRIRDVLPVEMEDSTS